MTAAALRYTLASLGCGIRYVLREELQETSREELISALLGTFRGAEELKGAVEEAFERSLQSLVIGLKQAWLLMEAGGEEDYCEAFGEKLRAVFVAEQQIEGRLFIDFLDGFFLDYDTAIDASHQILSLPDLEGAAFFEHLLAAGSEGADAASAAATEAIRGGFVNLVGLEEEHPIVRLGCWRDLLADGLHYHFTDIAQAHPSWSRYLEIFSPFALGREEGRAIAKRDEGAKERIAQIRAMIARRDAYKENFGQILPNREWLFDIADRLEEMEENVESDLLKGHTMNAHDLPKIVAAGVSKIHNALDTGPAGRLADVLTKTNPGIKDVLRRARRDFRRSHWGAEDYGDAALQLAGAMLPVAGPRAAERYYREAAAFGADKATCEFGLFLTQLLNGEFAAALDHLRRAVDLSPERYSLFDFQRYPPEAILGAGGSGPTFLVSPPGGERSVVKALWDPVSLVDPRPGLKPLALLHKAGVQGFPKLLHLGVNLKEFPFVATDFVEGDDLESFREVHGGDVPAHIVANTGAMVAERLVGVHEAGLVHGNLKPGNIRLGAGEEGIQVTLLDPCIPNVLLAAPGRVENVRRLLAWSRTGRVIAENFAGYTAPEVIKNGLEAATPQTDLYSLGAVLYRLSTGAPARSPDPAALPPQIREIVMQCLSRNPAERPKSAAEVQQALEAATETSSWGPEAEDDASLTTIAPPAAPPAEGFDPFAGLGTSSPDALRQPGLAPPPPPLTGADPFGAPPPSGAYQADPFGAPAADPFGAPPPAADPFALTSADPFAPAPGAPTGDPFGAPTADPFAAPAGADPFAPAAGDPFGAPPSNMFGGQTGAPVADPFAVPPGGDPFAVAPGGPGGMDPFAPTIAHGGPDPFAISESADPLAAIPTDPFAAVPMDDPFAAAAGDPFATLGPPPGQDLEEEVPLDPAEALALLEGLMSSSPKKPKPAPRPAAKKAPDPFAVPGGDPFAVPGGDPFAVPGGDPFAAAGGGDPFAAAGAGDPFAAAASQDPFAAAGGGGDPFAVPGGDPFAAAAGGGDPFAAPPGGDPFAAAASQDPFAAAGGGDPFAAVSDPFAAAGAAPVADPFAAAAGDPGLDPFAAAGVGDDPFAAAASADPFAAPAGADLSPGGLWLSEEVEQPEKPPSRKMTRGAGAASYGLVISGLGLKSKKEAAIQIIMEIKKVSEGEARDMCRSPVVPVLKNVSEEVAKSVESKFKAAKVNCRVTSKKRKR